MATKWIKSMIYCLWKYYYDSRYQQPVFIEQAHSLNYKFVQYKDKLISREYEENLLCYLYTNDYEAINKLPQFLKPRDNHTMRLLSERLDSSSSIALIINDEEYNRTINYSVIKQFNGFIITNDYGFGADKVLSINEILKDSSIDTIIIEKTEAMKHLGELDWYKTIVF